MSNTLKQLYNSLLNRTKRDSTQSFLPEVDGLRFYAIMPILLMHFGTALLDEQQLFDRDIIDETNLFRQIILHGEKGVYLFFGLSGFILSLPMFKNGLKKFSLKKYLLRRLYRIEPPYLIALLGFLVVHIILNEKELIFLINSFTASFFYLHNLIFQKIPYILPIAWSLEIEIQFYLLVPFLIFLALKFRTKTHRILFFFILCALSFVIELSSFLDLVDFLPFFLAGVIAADLFASKTLRFQYSNSLFLASLLLFFAIDIEQIAVLSLLLLGALSSFMNLSNWVRGLVISPIIVRIGGMCYTLYLLHYPLFYFFHRYFSEFLLIPGSYMKTFLLRFLVYFPICLSIMIVYFLAIEKYFMRMSKAVGK